MARSHSLVNPAGRFPDHGIIEVTNTASGGGGDVHIFLSGVGNKVSVTIAGGRSNTLAATDIKNGINAAAAGFTATATGNQVRVVRDNKKPFNMYTTTNETTQTYLVTVGLAQSQALASQVATMGVPALDTDGVEVSLYEWITVTGMIHNPTAGAATATFKIYVMDSTTELWYPHILTASSAASVGAATDMVAVLGAGPIRNKNYSRIAVNLDSLTAGCKFSCWVRGASRKDF